MSLWDALRMNMMISYQELVRTFLEIINALALSEWESEGRPADWQTRWESEYKHDASELLDELLKTLK